MPKVQRNETQFKPVAKCFPQGHGHDFATSEGATPQSAGWWSQWRYLRVGFGLLLIMAAILKWRAFGGSHSSALFDVAPQLEWLAIQFEVLLGLALLIGWQPRLTWSLTMLLLAAFGGANLMMIAQGRSSCGCLGVVQVPPLVMLFVDIVFLGFLWGARASIDSASVEKQKPHRLIGWGVASLIFGLALGALTIVRGAEIGSWLASCLPPSVSGQYVMSEPAVSDLGSGAVGEWRTVEVSIRNRSSEPITLIGSERNCRCRADSKLPLTLAPQEVVSISVEVKMGQTTGIQRDRFWLRTDHQRQPLLVCRWQAQVVPRDWSLEKTLQQSALNAHRWRDDHAVEKGTIGGITVANSSFVELLRFFGTLRADLVAGDLVLF